jgi:hypothetical protein
MAFSPAAEENVMQPSSAMLTDTAGIHFLPLLKIRLFRIIADCLFSGMQNPKSADSKKYRLETERTPARLLDQGNRYFHFCTIAVQGYLNDISRALGLYNQSQFFTRMNRAAVYIRDDVAPCKDALVEQTHNFIGTPDAGSLGRTFRIDPRDE